MGPIASVSAAAARIFWEAAQFRRSCCGPIKELFEVVRRKNVAQPGLGAMWACIAKRSRFLLLCRTI
jgi:hypothetical protein